jgi:hypothetical protein
MAAKANIPGLTIKVTEKPVGPLGHLKYEASVYREEILLFQAFNNKSGSVARRMLTNEIKLLKEFSND